MKLFQQRESKVPKMMHLQAFPVLRLGMTVPPIPISFRLVLALDGECAQSQPLVPFLISWKLPQDPVPILQISDLISSFLDHDPRGKGSPPILITLPLL